MQAKTIALYINLTFVCFMVAFNIFIDNGFTEPEDSVLATVNNVPITQSQLDHVILQYKAKTRKNQISPEEEDKLLKSLINRQLILGCDGVEKMRKEDSIVRQTKDFEDQLVIKRFLMEQVGSHLATNDEEIKIYYRNNLPEFLSPPRIRSSHILLRDKEMAHKIKIKLKQGEDFVDLAKKYSIDLPRALEGGSMGVIQKGKCLPELEKVLFLLDEGQMSDIVKTQYGYHILRVDQIIGDKYQPLAEVKEQIKKKLVLQKEAKAYEDMVTELEKDANIRIFGEQIAVKAH